MSTILGTADATEQGISYGWDRSRGPFTRRTFKGVRTAIDALIPQLVAQGYAYEVRQLPGNIYELEATIGDDVSGSGTNIANQVVETWELRPNKVQKDIFEADAAAIKALKASWIEQIKFWLNNPPRGGSDSIVWSDLAGDPVGTAATASNPVFKLMRAGVTHWNIHQPVLTHSLSVPLYANANFNFNNLGKLIPTAKLFTQEGLTSDYILPLNTLAAQFPAPSRTDGVTLVYGWYKGFPTMTTSSEGRRSVVVDYEFGLWSTLLYGSLV